jgi:hypothetical protein
MALHPSSLHIWTSHGFYLKILSLETCLLLNLPLIYLIDDHHLPFTPTYLHEIEGNVAITRLTDTERKLAKEFRTGAHNYFICFGSLPYAPPVLKVRDDFSLSAVSHPLTAIYYQVIKSGKHNYNGCRIPLPHNHLNVEAFCEMILQSNFPDNILAEFVEFGWPSGCISNTIPGESLKGNHASVRAQSDFYSKWIKKTHLKMELLPALF